MHGQHFTEPTLVSDLVSDLAAVFRPSMRGLRDASVGNEQAWAPESEPYLSAVAVLLWQNGQNPELSVTWSSLAYTVESIRDHVSSKVKTSTRGCPLMPTLCHDTTHLPFTHRLKQTSSQYFRSSPKEAV